MRKLTHKDAKFNWGAEDNEAYEKLKASTKSERSTRLQNESDHYPQKPTEKVIKAAHHLGHLGMTKTKQMIRGKYWFPTMNSMIEQIIGQCHERQVTTK